MKKEHTDAADIGINRYIMECKLESKHQYPPQAGELIDTLWNVN